MSTEPSPRPPDFKTRADGRGGLVRVTLVGEPHETRGSVDQVGSRPARCRRHLTWVRPRWGPRSVGRSASQWRSWSFRRPHDQRTHAPPARRESGDSPGKHPEPAGSDSGRRPQRSRACSSSLPSPSCPPSPLPDSSSPPSRPPTTASGDLGFLSSVSAVAVIVAFLALVVGLLERTHRRASGPAGRALGRGARNDRDTGRTLDELRAMSGTAGGAPARHTRFRDVSRAVARPPVVVPAGGRWLSVDRVGNCGGHTVSVLRSGDAPFVRPVRHPADAGPDAVETS